jgi:hypothetical protein
MTTALSRVTSPEERELNRHLQQIEGRKREIASLEADTQELHENLARFNAEYHARVGVLFTQIDQLELEIAEYRRRTDLLNVDPDASEQEILQRVQEEFSQQREKVQQEERDSERFWHQREAYRGEPSLTENDAAELKRLFRELARRFHPDLAKTDEEREERTRIMQQVNTAYHARNLDVLHTLTSREDVDDRSFSALSIADKLIWAIRELARLNDLYDQLINTYHELRTSSLAVLWFEKESGNDPLDRLERELIQRLGLTRAKRDDALRRYEFARMQP